MPDKWIRIFAGSILTTILMISVATFAARFGQEPLIPLLGFIGGGFVGLTAGFTISGILLGYRRGIYLSARFVWLWATFFLISYLNIISKFFNTADATEVSLFFILILLPYCLAAAYLGALISRTPKTPAVKPSFAAKLLAALPVALMIAVIGFLFYSGHIGDQNRRFAHSDNQAGLAMRRLVDCQKAYMAERRTYTADLAALRETCKGAPPPSDQITITISHADAESWQGTAQSNLSGLAYVYDSNIGKIQLQK